MRSNTAPRHRSGGGEEQSSSVNNRNLSNGVQKNQCLFRRRKLTGEQQRMFRRRSELIRLLEDRAKNGVVSDIRKVARVAVNAMVYADVFKGGVYPDHIQLPGVPTDLLADLINEEEKNRKIAQASGDAPYLPLSSRVAGAMIDLCRIERDDLQIRTMLAIDQTDEERQQANAERRRERDRIRQQQKREFSRVPRDRFLATSISAIKPWEVEQISRAAWYRRRQNQHCK